MRLVTSALLVVASIALPARARADDASTAVSELKVGYALKQAGNCREARPHFLASVRLSATAKALLNAADCESRTGDFVSAKLHATQGRELARQGPDGAELVSVADDLLASIDKRLAHLTIKLGAGAPTDCTVLRDGVAIDAATIGTPSDENPGPHAVTVKAVGHDDRAYDVSLGEGQRSELVVDVGAAAPTIAPNPYGQAAVTPDKPASSSTEAPSLWATITATRRNEIAAALVVGGVLSAFVGSAFGIAAISNNNASNANGHCDSTGCDPTGVSLRNTALTDATLSTVLFVVGLASIGGGVALYLTAPRSEATAATGIQLAPLVVRSSVGLGLRGVW